jgi:hypothetical protein
VQRHVTPSLVQSLQMNHTFHYSLEKMQFFEAIFKIFAKTVFEVFEVKRGRMVK